MRVSTLPTQHGERQHHIMGGVAVVAVHHGLVIVEDSAFDLRFAHLDGMDGFGALQGQADHEKPGHSSGNGAGQEELSEVRVHGVLASLNSETR